MGFRELKPDEWLEEVDYGLEYRQKFGLEQLWGPMEAIYYNVHESMANDGPNIFLSQGDSMLSMVTVPSPKIRVKPETPEAVGKAPLVEGIDNLLLRSMDLMEQGETCCLHAYLFGRGILKIGYDSEWGYDPTMDVGGTLRLGLTMSQLDKKGERRLEHDSNVVPGMPWVRAVLPHDIVVPWGTRSINTAPWIAHRIVRHIDDLRADRKYSSTRDLQPQLSYKDFVDSYANSIKVTRGGSNREPEYIELWEIQDKRTGMIYVVTGDHQKYLRRETNALQIDNRLPYVGISFVPRVRAFWTTPDVYYLFHIQNELSDVARQRTKQRRIATLKFIYDNNVMSEEELEKILSPDVGAAAKIQAGAKLSDAVMRLDNQVNQTLALEEEHLRQNAREQIGFSRNQMGEYTGGRKTAREVNAVERSSQLRMSKRGLAVKRMYEDVFSLINPIIFKYWSIPRFIEVLGAKRAEQWQMVSGIELKDRYSYEVTLVDEQEEKQREFEALQLYGILSQDPTIDPVALREYLVNEINTPNFERLFNADVQLAMSALRQAGGVVQSQNGRQGGAAGMSRMQGQNGTANSSSLVGPLAQRGLSP